MFIELLPEEKKRIEQQGWTEADGVSRESMIVKEGKRFRLGHQEDGACVFLDPSGRCRIHARFGEEAKPRACRLFPLALHPAGTKLLAGLRFSCPSAVANAGKPLSQQVPDLRKLASLIVPDNFEKIPAPPVVRQPGLEWPDFLRFVGYLDKTLAEPGTTVALKLQRALCWLDAVKTAQFDTVSGAGADEILGLLVKSAAEKLPAGSPGGSPSRFGWLLFRTLVFVYARKDSVRDLHPGAGYRLKMLKAMVRFSLGRATLPSLQPDFKEVEFAALAKPFGPLPAEAEAMLTRFFRVKIQSLHFCGRAYYNVPLIEGFQSLALLHPVILWLARWRAAGDGRAALMTDDVAKAIALTDHHHGYSPALGTDAARRRVRLLAQRGDIARLCGALEK